MIPTILHSKKDKAIEIAKKKKKNQWPQGVGRRERLTGRKQDF